MPTLQELCAAAGDSDEAGRAYDAARAAKVSEIAAYIADLMRDPHHADAIAETIMANAEEMGRIDGDAVNGELAGRYTKTGNPLPFSI